MPGQILKPTGLLRTEDDHRESRIRPKSTTLRRKRHRLTPYRVHQAETAPGFANPMPPRTEMAHTSLLGLLEVQWDSASPEAFAKSPSLDSSERRRRR